MRKETVRVDGRDSERREKRGRLARLGVRKDTKERVRSGRDRARREGGTVKREGESRMRKKGREVRVEA